LSSGSGSLLCLGVGGVSKKAVNAVLILEQILGTLDALAFGVVGK